MIPAAWGLPTGALSVCVEAMFLIVGMVLKVRCSGDGRVVWVGVQSERGSVSLRMVFEEGMREK